MKGRKKKKRAHETTKHPGVLEDPDEMGRDFMGQDVHWAGTKKHEIRKKEELAERTKRSLVWKGGGSFLFFPK